LVRFLKDKEMGLDLTGFGSIADLAGGLLERFWPKDMDPAEKARINIEMQKVLEERENIVLKAKENVLVQELKQSDNYTKRARPTVVYSGVVFVALNYALLPMIAWIFLVVTGKPIQLPDLSLPPQFWFAWTGICSTYSIGRTMEKRGNVNKIVSMVTGNK
jgi:hypothetical protein